MRMVDVLMRELGGGEGGPRLAGGRAMRARRSEAALEAGQTSDAPSRTPSAKQCACPTTESTNRIVVWALARQCSQCGAARRLRQAGVPVRPCLCSKFSLPSAASLAHTAPDAAQSTLRQHFVGLLCITGKSAEVGCSLLRRGILLKNQGSADASVWTTHAARAGKPPAYADRAGGMRDWRCHMESARPEG